MKIEISRDNVEEGEPFYKELTVYGNKRQGRGSRVDSCVKKFTSNDLDLYILSPYISSTDGSISAAVIIYRPEAAETINGVDIFYKPDIDWEEELSFNIYDGNVFIECIFMPRLKSLVVLKALATMEGITRIEVFKY
jgi:hypothetical protein